MYACRSPRALRQYLPRGSTSSSCGMLLKCIELEAANWKTGSRPTQDNKTQGDATSSPMALAPCSHARLRVHSKSKRSRFMTLTPAAKLCALHGFACKPIGGRLWAGHVTAHCYKAVAYCLVHRTGAARIQLLEASQRKHCSLAHA